MNDNWKIYTKTGDKGMTSLLGGTRVPKNHPRVEVYGTIDELNSFIGFLRDQPIDMHTKEILVGIQESLFTAESQVAADHSAGRLANLPALCVGDVEKLEKEIDAMNEKLPALTSFILPGGHAISSTAHVCRCVCRRAERLAIQLDHTHPLDPLIIQYLNRLSDYLFVLARKLLFENGGEETIWNTKT